MFYLKISYITLLTMYYIITVQYIKLKGSKMYNTTYIIEKKTQNNNKKNK